MSSLCLMAEPIGLVFASLAFKFHSPLYESVNEKLLQMISNGVISKLAKDVNNRYDRKPILEDIGPQVLTMDDLVIGFQFCCIPLVLGVIAFLGELAVFRLKKLKETLTLKMFKLLRKLILN